MNVTAMKATFILLLCGLSLLGFSQTTAIKSKGVKHPVYLGKTRPLKNIAPLEEQINSEESVEKISPIAKRSLNAKYDDPVIQDYKGQNDPILVLHDFEGLSSQGSPNPDTEGDVGPNHYFQMVKSEFAIWDKQGTLLYGPAANVTLWSDFPGPWLELGWTDPVVLYDHLADRWLASCMVYDINVEYYEMIAVSATPDPLGEWFCYYVWFDVMPDYPKFGVWPDGYYLSINEWEIVGSYATFQGASILAFNREELMNGTADPTVIYFHFDAPNHSTTTDIGSFLPCDLDGISPPVGTPNYFVCV